IYEGEKEMTYSEAVELAKNNEERGFNFLYQNTYKSKLYLALQYMKNEEDAQDVLQDAYVKAILNLHSLQNTEKFTAWLRRIVANTAKNALVKKNPVSFSDVSSESEDEPFEFQIEDDDINHQPELSYTKEETRQLVRELIDSLSEEQRICVLMFHIEGASIREIAEALDCTENTVKSRLNYGRKNIKKKAEALQKKGYKLYGLAPLPFLLWLLHEDAYAMSLEQSFQAAGGAISDAVFRELPFYGNKSSLPRSNATKQQGGKCSYANSVGASGTGHTTGTGLLHTAAGKALIAAIVAAVIAGSAIGITMLNRSSENDRPAIVQEETAADLSAESVAKEENTPVETEEDITRPQEAADEDYSDLLEGELTKDELEFILAYGPEELTEAGLSDSEYEIIRNQLCQSSANGLNMLTEYGTDSSYRRGYSVSELNRLFSVFTDYRFTEENDSDTQYGTDVDGDTIWASAAELNFIAAATITDASYTEDEMTVNFHFHKEVDDYEFSYTTDTDKTAILRKNENGNFHIVSIMEAESLIDAESSAGQASDGASDTEAIRALYEEVLQSASNGSYTFPQAGASAESYWYFVTDMDGDCVSELIVAAQFESDVFYWYDCIVFDVESGLLKQIDGDICVLSAYIPADENGFLGMTDFSRGSGQTEIHRITTQSGSLSISGIEYDFISGSDENAQFSQSNPMVTWLDISDFSGLDEIN
ncbi:MAG: sigma-70 family RNA polymerase sigma factor, partial [Oscillospiraceae bacterium]|nr:sigma-70 family RNA polymerase sigma factor [Oscillospiraceae bacterium]